MSCPPHDTNARRPSSLRVWTPPYGALRSPIDCSALLPLADRGTLPTPSSSTATVTAASNRSPKPTDHFLTGRPIQIGSTYSHKPQNSPAGGLYHAEHGWRRWGGRYQGAHGSGAQACRTKCEACSKGSRPSTAGGWSPVGSSPSARPYACGCPRCTVVGCARASPSATVSECPARAAQNTVQPDPSAARRLCGRGCRRVARDESPLCVGNPPPALNCRAADVVPQTGRLGCRRHATDAVAVVRLRRALHGHQAELHHAEAAAGRHLPASRPCILAQGTLS
jgi:hypothetical protein